MRPLDRLRLYEDVVEVPESAVMGETVLRQEGLLQHRKCLIEATVRLVREMGAWENPHVLCYQSRVGPGEWLKPSLLVTLRELAGRGRRRLLVIPIAFVTDHIETLHEINIEAREVAERAGITQFEMMPALNDHPLYIQCLADLVLKNV